jgi:hypothetical protein
MSNPNLVAINLALERGQRFADQFLVGERAIDLGGVEEGHATVHRRPDQRDHFLPVRRVTVPAQEWPWGTQLRFTFRLEGWGRGRVCSVAASRFRQLQELAAD